MTSGCIANAGCYRHHRRDRVPPGEKSGMSEIIRVGGLQLQFFQSKEEGEDSLDLSKIRTLPRGILLV